MWTSLEEDEILDKELHSVGRLFAKVESLELVPRCVDKGFLLTVLIPLWHFLESKTRECYNPFVPE